MDAIIQLSPAIKRAMSLFKRRGGTMRMAEAVRAGIHRDTLRAMTQGGILNRLGRGMYQLVDARSSTHPDLALTAKRVPHGVVCLISALDFHELTSEIPHEIYLAIPRNQTPPRLSYPPIRCFRFSGRAFTEGIESHDIGPTAVRIYSREKTLADCFKFRNKIGLDLWLEAIRRYREQRGYNLEKLLHYAQICRVANRMRPYLESLL